MDKIVKIGSSVEDDFEADQLTITVSIEESFDSKEECTQAYNTNLGLVRSKLAQAGVSDSAVSTRRFTLRPHTERLYYKKSRNDYYYARTVVEGYEYSGEVVVTISDLGLAAPIWLALSDCDSAITFDMDFGLADETPARDSLLQRAVQEGERNARILAKASGAELGPISSIQYDFRAGGFGYHDDRAYAPTAFGAAPDAAAAPEFIPEPIRISCHVDCVWALHLQ